MSTNRPDFLRRWVPDWLLASAQTHNDLLERKLERLGVTMAAYGLFKGIAEVGVVGLCIYAASLGADPTLVTLIAGAVVLGWEGFEKWMLLTDVDPEVLEQLQNQSENEEE